MSRHDPRDCVGMSKNSLRDRHPIGRAILGDTPTVHPVGGCPPQMRDRAGGRDKKWGVTRSAPCSTPYKATSSVRHLANRFRADPPRTPQRRPQPESGSEPHNRRFSGDIFRARSWCTHTHPGHALGARRTEKRFSTPIPPPRPRITPPAKGVPKHALGGLMWGKH